MANLDQPRGFWPHGPCKRISPYIAASAIYPGDAVKLNNAGQVAIAAAGDALVGVAMSYVSASGAEVLVADSPDQLFCGQCDEADVDALTDMNLNYNILATAGSSTYKISRQEVDSSTQATDSNLPLKVLRLNARPDNALGANAVVVFLINNHQLKGSTGTLGV